MNPAGNTAVVPAHIIVADDSATERLFVSRIVQAMGHHVTNAVDGVQAVQLCYQHRPDLVILDLNMPRINGYQACRLLKSESDFADIPVILLTAAGGPSDRFWGLQTGADGYLTKDNVSEDIPRLVTEMLKRPASGGYADNVSRRASLVTEEYLLSRLAHLLDRCLFEATVVNELSKLAASLASYDDTVRAALSLVGRLFDHSATALMLADPGQDPPVALYIHKCRPAGPHFVESFAARTLEEWSRLLGQARLEPHSTILIDGAEPVGAEPPAEAVASFLSVPFSRGDKPTGLLALGGARPLAAAQESMRLLERIAPQVHLVVDNARLYREVHHLAITDGMTGLYNRRYADELLGHEFARSVRYQSPLSVLLMDIDLFKRINDHYGHATGDLVLQRIAKVLQSGVRSADIVGRYGGEEIIVILPQTLPDNALRTAERLRKAVRALAFPEIDDELRVTVSIGLSGWETASEDATDREALVRQADAALYEAKREGRDQIRVWPTA